MLTSKQYDILKAIAQIWLPALGTLVFTMGDIWGLSNVSQIVGSITAIDTFLGVGLGLSSRNFKKGGFDGDLVVDQTDPHKDLYKLAIKTPLDEIPGKDTIQLKVKPAPDIHSSI